MEAQETPRQVENIRLAHNQLVEDVRVALRVQMGDARRLGLVRTRVLAVSTAAEQVRYKSIPIYLLLNLL